MFRRGGEGDEQTSLNERWTCNCGCCGTRALNAITNVVFADDSQVVDIRASKEYGAPGVVVVVHRVQEGEIRSE